MQGRAVTFITLPVLEPTDITLPTCMPGQRISVAVAKNLKKGGPTTRPRHSGNCAHAHKNLYVFAQQSKRGLHSKKGPLCKSIVINNMLAT